MFSMEAEMKIKRFIGGVIESNGYIIYQSEGGPCFIIDPGYKYKKFLNFMKERSLKPAGIILTHAHYDHMGDAEKLRREALCEVFIHAEEADEYGSEATAIYDGDVFDLEGEELKVIHTPGHTKGGMCLFSEKSKNVFTGDTIFNVDLGRTDLPGGSDADMARSLREIIDKWDNDITIYPGHGDSCNMKYVREVNKEFLDIVGDK